MFVVSEGVVDGGEGCGEPPWIRGPNWEAATMSRPAVKALGPAPEKMMTRTEGEVERWEKI